MGDYLAGAPALDEALLRRIERGRRDEEAEAALDVQLARIVVEIRRRREAHERRYGVLIIPEEPTLP